MRLRRDWILVGVLMSTSILEVILRSDVTWPLASLVLALLVLPTLLIRRTDPLLAVALAFGSVAVLDIAWLFFGSGPQPGLYSMGAVLILTYALFRWGSGRDAIIGVGIMAVPATIASIADYTGLGDLIGGFAVLISSMAIGVLVRVRSGARERRIELVKIGEREQLARDLHDTVAHHVTAIVVRAQAGIATAPNDPTAAVDALRVIEREATRTLGEMRSMVGVLRNNAPASTAPDPSAVDLVELSGVDSPGPAVHVELHGAVAELPQVISTAVFRLAQESITNARRHAHGATRITVVVDVDGERVRARIHDDGSAPTSPNAETGGFGVTGMTERAHLLGGTCVAGPDPDGGWTVTAELPLAGVRT